MRAAISRLAREAAVESAKSFRMEFDEPRFRGVVHPVDVHETLELTLSRFEMTGDRITAELETSLPFQVEGQVTVTPEMEPIDCQARVLVRVHLQASVSLQLDRSTVQLKPLVSELRADFTVEKIVPDNFVSADQLTVILNGLFAQHRERAVKTVNELLDAHPLGKGVMIDTGDQGDNPLIRGLIARSLHDELSKRGNMESGWHGHQRESDDNWLKQYRELTHWFWLDDPARHLTVGVPEFKLRDGKLSFRAEAQAKVAARIHSKASFLGETMIDNHFSMTADAKVAVEGTLQLGVAGPENPSIDQLTTEITNFRSPAVLADWLRHIVTDKINQTLRDHHAELKQDFAIAIAKLRW